MALIGRGWSDVDARFSEAGPREGSWGRIPGCVGASNVQALVRLSLAATDTGD